ncbi:MAG: hypothetical protein FP814_14615 [Desulfobacterium sp.]|nr:hypothetical protein [Desulfobacterium sp.]MBU3949337.1 hypothetical protein [Pseudomonadota bacterium]MBU4010440.1 hypothetical protein [Pseudomonadota bacterium]MBU4035371.1 hypothetical protein [Pseudomonadota bacterium]
MKKYAVLLFVALLFASGCATQKSWVYSPNSYSDISTTITKSVVVLPFQDTRPNTNSNYVALYMIPVMPFGWQTLNVPEGQAMHIYSGMWVNYKPTEDYPKALAEELNGSKLFEEAYFDFKKGNSDLAVKGKILTTKYSGTIISYGLSVYGPMLWFVGFPSGTVSNELSIELSLVDSQSDKVILSNNYTAPEYSRVGWLYVMPNDFNYPAMLKDIYKNFIEDVRTRIPEISAKLADAGK